MVLADGKAVLRNLASWMKIQKMDKRKGKMIPSGKKLTRLALCGINLNSFRMPCSTLKSFKDKEGRCEI